MDETEQAEEPARREPSLRSNSTIQDGLASAPDVASAAPPVRKQAAPAKPPPEDRLVVLHVKAHNGDAFAGEALAQAFAESELQYGEMQVFQRTVKFAGKDEVLFRVASMVKPGTFDLSRLRDQQTPGLALFMQLPGPMEGVKAFNTMLHCAQGLATRLGGDVLDQTREPLEQPIIDRMRGEIQLFGLQRRQAGLDD
jgi:cell division protein ZipA